MPKKRPKAEDWTDPTGLLLLQSWAQQGLSQEEICTNMERLRGVPIAPRTLRRWIAKYPATIGVAFNNGREASIAIVENALFQKASKGCPPHTDTSALLDIICEYHSIIYKFCRR